ncbi:MAG TPA: septum formation protein Maf [Candidatus Hydrogenedentes bacterium]|nr:septum formation protein Maf [Candidatus Hydrogenedentota bacterium]
MNKVVLASASPRRRYLLAALGIDFDVCAADIEECDTGGAPAAIVEANARAKCHAVAPQTHDETLIIAADTLVFLDGTALSKPANMEEARAMLGRLAGNTHQVVTGLALLDKGTGRTAIGSESTDVTFRTLTAEEINRFVETVRPLDRAGAYTVDGPGSLLVSRYDGCYQNVLGLPIVRLDKLMRALGYSLFDMIEPDKARFL